MSPIAAASRTPEPNSSLKATQLIVAQKVQKNLISDPFLNEEWFQSQ